MQVKQDGDWLTITRVTGPHHNLLSLRLDRGDGAASPMPTIEALDGDAAIDGIAEENLLKEVKAGAAAANKRLGKNYRIRAIRFLRSDSPPVEVYRALAERLIFAAVENDDSVSLLRAAG